MNRKVTIVGLVVITIALAFGTMLFLKSMKENPQKDLNRRKVPFVEVQKVKYHSVEASIIEKGRLVSNLEVNLSSEVAGRIVESGVPLKVGQKFKRGDLLIRIYDEDAKMDLKAQKSRFLNKLAANLPDIKVDYSSNFNSWMTFFNSIDLEKDLPKLPAVKTDAEKVFMASRNILGDYYAIKSAEVKLAKRKIFAPFDGSYIDVNTQVGAVAGMGSKLASIIESGNLELKVPVESKDIKWLNLNDPVDIIDVDGNVLCGGRLIRKSEFVDQGTQSVSVFVKINRSANVDLYQGQFISAKFNGKVISDAMEIPRNAVFRSNRVYVVEKDILKERQINILKYNENTLVFNGLNEGELIVVDPPVKAAENMKVQVRK